MILRISLILLALSIAYLSLSPTSTITISSDKINHFIAYFVLMTNAGLISVSKGKPLFLAAGLVIFYGGLMEACQYFVPGRFTSFYDFLANLGGVISSALILIAGRGWLKRLLTSLGIN